MEQDQNETASTEGRAIPLASSVYCQSRSASHVFAFGLKGSTEAVRFSFYIGRLDPARFQKIKRNQQL